MKAKLLREYNIIYYSCAEEIAASKYLKSIGENIYNYDDIINQKKDVFGWNCFKFYEDSNEWGRCYRDSSNYELNKKRINYKSLVRKEKLKKINAI